MDTAEIEREVARLAPWYYRYDLAGVPTDQHPPCDHHGHRVAVLPPAFGPYLEGKRVLDVACNEGGYSFEALDKGAASVRGFDVRAVNVEKASFVARVRGLEDRTDFEVSNCDDFARTDNERFDYVFLCGLLYHLTEPWRTVEEYCSRATEGIFCTCVVHGGDVGYTPFAERETIAASEDPDEMSMMPNGTTTLTAEFRKHGFLPVLIYESRQTELWGACELFLRNCRDMGCRELPMSGEASSDFELAIVPRRRPGAHGDVRDGRQRPFDADLSIFHLGDAPRELDGFLRVLGANDRVRFAAGPERLSVAGRVVEGEERIGTSLVLPLELDLGDDGRAVQVELRERGGSDVLAARVLEID